MDIGIIDNAYTEKYGYEEGIRRLKAHGYSCIDFQGFVDTDGPLWQLPKKQFAAGLQNTREFLAAEGIRISQVHAPWCWPPRNATPDERRERFEKMEQALAGTKILGAKNFVVHPIMPFENDPGQDAESVIGTNLGFLGRLVDFARYYDITVCLENMPFDNLPLSTPEEIRDFVEDVNQPNFKVCLDTGHSACRGVPPGDAVRVIGPELLACLHVHDNDGKGDLHWLPERGVIDWKDFRQALMDIHFQGTLSIECHPKNDADEIYLANTAKSMAGSW